MSAGCETVSKITTLGDHLLEHRYCRTLVDAEEFERMVELTVSLCLASSEAKFALSALD
jgi:hypothetical protein